MREQEREQERDACLRCTDADLAIGNMNEMGVHAKAACIRTLLKKKGGEVPSLLAVVLSSPPHSSLLFAAESQLLSR